MTTITTKIEDIVISNKIKTEINNKFSQVQKVIDDVMGTYGVDSFTKLEKMLASQELISFCKIDRNTNDIIISIDLLDFSAYIDDLIQALNNLKV